MVFEFVPEMLQAAPDDRPGGGIAERAVAAAVHHALSGQVHAGIAQQVQVFQSTLAVLDPGDDLLDPVRPDPAGHALPTGLVRVEVSDPLADPHDASCIIEDYHAAGAEARTRRR